MLSVYDSLLARGGVDVTQQKYDEAVNSKPELRGKSISEVLGLGNNQRYVQTRISNTGRPRDFITQLVFTDLEAPSLAESLQTQKLSSATLKSLERQGQITSNEAESLRTQKTFINNQLNQESRIANIQSAIDQLTGKIPSYLNLTTPIIKSKIVNGVRIEYQQQTALDIANNIIATRNREALARIRDVATKPVYNYEQAQRKAQALGILDEYFKSQRNQSNVNLQQLRNQIVPTEFGGSGISFKQAAEQGAALALKLARRGTSPEGMKIINSLKNVPILFEGGKLAIRTTGASVGLVGRSIQFITDSASFNVIRSAKALGIEKLNVKVDSSTAKLVAFLQKPQYFGVGPIVLFRNPLKFVNISGNTVLVSQRAIGESVGAAGDIFYLLGGVGKPKVVQVNSVGEISRVVGELPKEASVALKVEKSQTFFKKPFVEGTKIKNYEFKSPNEARIIPEERGQTYFKRPLPENQIKIENYNFEKKVVPFKRPVEQKFIPEEKGQTYFKKPLSEKQVYTSQKSFYRTFPEKPKVDTLRKLKENTVQLQKEIYKPQVFVKPKTIPREGTLSLAQIYGPRPRGRLIFNEYVEEVSVYRPKFKDEPRQFSKIETRFISATKSLNKFNGQFKSNQKSLQKSVFVPKTKVNQQTISISLPKPVQQFKQKTIQIPRIKTRVLQQFKQKYIFKPKTEQTIIQTPRTNLISSQKFYQEKFKKFSKTGKAFDVYSRKNKKEFKINRVPLVYQSALALGHNVVENSTARSFFVRKTKGVGRRINLGGFPSQQYRFPKRNTRLQSGSLVEKSKFAINTRGEKQGLSIARYIAQSRNKILKKNVSLKFVKKKKR